MEWISVISMVATTVSAAAAFATACMAKRSNDRSLQNIEDAKYADFVMWEAHWDIDENSGKGFVLFANVGDSPAKTFMPPYADHCPCPLDRCWTRMCTMV